MKVDSDRPAASDGRAFHIGLKGEDVASFCLLPGDPARSDAIAATWDEARLVGNHREHRSFTGKLAGLEMTVCSTGVGGPSASNALEELAALGAHTFIRVGTTGALSDQIPCGDLIISTGAVRHDGTSDLYVEPAYPAFAHYQVVEALVRASDHLGIRAHLGVSCSTSSFYAGQGRPGLRSLRAADAPDVVEKMRALGVLNFEMEAATLMTLGSLYGLRVGCVCAVIANRVTKALDEKGIDRAVAVANLAARFLAEADRQGPRPWHA